MGRCIMSSIDDAFELEPVIIEEYERKEIPASIGESEDIKTDYEYARTNLYNIVENGNVALGNLVNLSKETEHPRSYEVLGQLMKVIGDTTEKITVLHEKQAKLDTNRHNETNITNNSLFVGSATDLLDMLKK
jgi:hypothetical protein